MATTEATRQTREAITALLRQDPTLTAPELWERCQGRGIRLTAKSTFLKHHCPWARKELGIDPEAAAQRGRAKGLEVRQAKRAKAAPARPKKPSPAPEPIKEPESNEECPKGDPAISGAPTVSFGPATLSITPPEASTGELATFRQTLVDQLAELEREARVLRTGIALVDRYAS